MVKKSYVPDTGDIVWIDLDPQAGREQAKRRPALVLSPASYNRASGLVVVCPVTSVRKGYPFEIPAAIAGKEGAVLADQVKSMDWQTRRAVFLEKAHENLLRRTRAYLALLLGLARAR
jgi:mRNA interferase MazF